LKSIISRVANSVIFNSETRRNKARRAESGDGFLDRGSVSYVVWGALYAPPAGSGKFGFLNILGSQKSRQNGQLAFESGGGQQVNLGGGASALLPHRRTAPEQIHASFLFGHDVVYP